MFSQTASRQSEVQNGGKEKRGAAKLNESKLAQINNGTMIVSS